MAKTILVRGVGDVGSAVAHALFQAGHRVVLHDTPSPINTRRGMAFLDAIFDGPVVLAGVVGKLARDTGSLERMLKCRKAVPVSVEAMATVMEALTPDALVDARMMKRSVPEPQIAFAPLTIGLGPNHTAGATTHVAVETAWGDDLGVVVRAGPTKALEGGPRVLAGVGRERFLYAPMAGVFITTFEIGQVVAQDCVIATIGEHALRAPIAGTIRGLTHTGVHVPGGAKVLEIDPRTQGDAQVFGLGERPCRIATGVLNALEGEGRVGMTGR